MKNNSKDDDEQQSERVHGPHPTTGHRPPGHLRPLRPCRCDTAQSQCEHLATRANGACGQGVGAPSHLSKSSFPKAGKQSSSSCIKAGRSNISCPKAGSPEKIPQVDGNASLNSESEDDQNDKHTDYETDDEVDSEPVRATLVPSISTNPGDPLQLEVDTTGQANIPKCIPLCTVTNPRSAWNKVVNIRTFLQQIGPDFMILSEHWGRKKPFEKTLAAEHYKVLESSRGTKAIPTRGRNGIPGASVTGGGVAIVYNEENFKVEDPGVKIPEGVEAVWALLTPKSSEIAQVKRILVGGIYISPRSLKKQETIEHIIATMHSVQSRFDDTIRFFISGDFNKVSIEDILESNGSLQQICSVATRKSATLELVITCMAKLLHPPTTLDPIKQDENTPGRPSDHNVLVVAPRSDLAFTKERQKTSIHMRPLPDSKIQEFMNEVSQHHWFEVLNQKNAHEKAKCFHDTLISLLDKHFPKKTVKMTTLDKKWFNPGLKMQYNEMQKEFFKNAKSDLWKKLKKSYRRSKRRACKSFYSNFVTDLKTTNPGLFHKMAKRIGAIEQSKSCEIKIECLESLNPDEQVQKVANSMAKVSNEYQPVDISKLPAYLPSERPPQTEEHKVWNQIKKQKKTKTTLELDIPDKLRQEAAIFLAKPLTNVFNSCLQQGVYPRIWKLEYVTPVPKKAKALKNLNDVRKIASTSDYSKAFEHILLQWINEDISKNLSKRQYGGKKGVGTEHLIVTLVDKIKNILDNPESDAVILNSYDWSGAFDRVDPTEVAIKLVKVGIRSSLVKVLIDFLNERKMIVKMNGKTSSTLDLIGGGPQGSIIGQLLYIIASDDVAEDTAEEEKFKYIDDLSLVDAITTKNNLVQYDVNRRVPNDVATEQLFLPTVAFKSQARNENISKWTCENKMKLNTEKSNYMVITRKKETFATRLKLDDKTVERQTQIRHLGVWLSENMSWDKNISEICKKAYARIRMLSKLKYVGTTQKDLVLLYCLHIRSITEYCSTAFHSSLTARQSNKLETIQKTCLRIILGEEYLSYDSALTSTGLISLKARREKRELTFALKCVKHPSNSSIFPLNPSQDPHNVRKREIFQVNQAKTETYRTSTIPHLQRRLNLHFANN